MEEQRARHQQEQGEGGEVATPAGVGGATEESSEEALLQRALAMSMDIEEKTGNKEPDLANMSEEEQIAYAMQMSMADTDTTESMDVDTNIKNDTEVMNDAAFLQSVLHNLPGVDPQSEAVQDAMEAAKKEEDKKENENK